MYPVYDVLTETWHVHWHCPPNCPPSNTSSWWHTTKMHILGPCIVTPQSCKNSLLELLISILHWQDSIRFHFMYGRALNIFPWTRTYMTMVVALSKVTWSFFFFFFFLVCVGTFCSKGATRLTWTIRAKTYNCMVYIIMPSQMISRALVTFWAEPLYISRQEHSTQYCVECSYRDRGPA